VMPRCSACHMNRYVTCNTHLCSQAKTHDNHDFGVILVTDTLSATHTQTVYNVLLALQAALRISAWVTLPAFLFTILARPGLELAPAFVAAVATAVHTLLCLGTSWCAPFASRLGTHCRPAYYHCTQGRLPSRMVKSAWLLILQSHCRIHRL
jgi:hypothetical protein